MQTHTSAQKQACTRTNTRKELPSKTRHMEWQDEKVRMRREKEREERRRSGAAEGQQNIS